MEGYKKNATIHLDSTRGVFYPGQVITGKIEIELDAPLTISVIYVKFLGEANVNWTEEESEEINGNKRYKKVEYVGREEYFKGSALLAGSYGSIVNLNPGKHSYNFQHRLPPGIPSTFTGERGGVVYTVTGHIEFQGQKLFDEVVKIFDVVAPFDLNKGNACVKEPIEMEFEEVYNCGCFCGSGPVTIRARLPFSAYCPGQVIPVEVVVENKSSVEISNLIFELLTRERYRTQRPVAEYVQPEAVMTSLKKGSIMSGNTRNFTLELLVPDLIAPNLELCSIIDVGYFFRMTIKLSGCNSDLQDESEICLGLVPLKETVEGTYVHPMAHSLPVDPIPDREEIPNQAFGQNVRVETMPQFAAPKVPDGSSYFVQVNQQVISSDPSKNYQIGFKATYPPGSEIPPAFNPQFGQFNAQSWPPPFEGDFKIPMGDMMNTNQNFASPNLGGYPVQNNSFVTSNLAQTNSFVPHGRSPVPSAPPM